jgi:precorrin-6B C5,15-methyltransferase / cobalt-precorrin-6B C5,C15-methyltransferase
VTARRRWLSIVGIGEDGLDGLSPAARRLVAQAALVVGGARHLRLAAVADQRGLAWPSPIEAALPQILARRGEPVCVLASGDPFFYGVGSLLMREVDAEEVVCLPSPSAFSLAAARLGWSLQDCVTLSLHGRPLEAAIPHLQPGARILALSWDGATPGKFARLLAARGMGRSRLTICEAMGGPDERLHAARAEDFACGDVAALNTIAVEIVAAPGASIVARASGLPDALFEHDGQITKREARAMTLAALAPRRGELLWDVGAGCGSVAIEWMLCDPANRAVAIERRPDRAARIARNAAALGVPGLAVVAGSAPEALAGLPAPDAVFIGGGVTAAGVVRACWDALGAGGRLVADAVTLEGQAVLLDWWQRRGGTLTRIGVERAGELGTFTAWRPALPVVQWSVRKGSKGSKESS